MAAALEAEEVEDDATRMTRTRTARDDGGEGRRRGQPKRRRRGRRGGRAAGAAHASGPSRAPSTTATEGYGLWLDPAVQDDPVYAEHWAGHRPVTVVVEADRIVITRAGEGAARPTAAPPTATSCGYRAAGRGAMARRSYEISAPCGARRRVSSPRAPPGPRTSRGNRAPTGSRASL